MKNLIYPCTFLQDYLDIHEYKHWVGLWNEKLCASLEKQLLQIQAKWGSSPLKFFPEVECLYKYRSFDIQHPERTREILSEHKLWSPSMHSLNDPMESGFHSSEDHVENDAAFSFIYMMRSQWCGCISFSRDPVSSPMWSHYSSDHTGFCIKYRRQDSILLSFPSYCRPVMYRSNVPKLSLKNVNNFSSMIDEVFWTKSGDWENEREWRLRYPRTDSYTHTGLLKPEGVIFGLKTDPKVKDYIRKCAPDLRYGVIVPGKNDYRLRVVWEDIKS